MAPIVEAWHEQALYHQNQMRGKLEQLQHDLNPNNFIREIEPANVMRPADEQQTEDFEIDVDGLSQWPTNTGARLSQWLTNNAAEKIRNKLRQTTEGNKSDIELETTVEIKINSSNTLSQSAPSLRHFKTHTLETESSYEIAKNKLKIEFEKV